MAWDIFSDVNIQGLFPRQILFFSKDACINLFLYTLIAEPVEDFPQDGCKRYFFYDLVT